MQHFVLFLIFQLENKNVKENCSADEDPNEESNTKKCPLFEKCQGNGNTNTLNGKRHTAIKSCPIFLSFGTDKILEKKLKELTEEKSELLKINNTQNEKIFEYEKELLTFKNQMVFDYQEEMENLKINIDQFREENEKLKK